MAAADIYISFIPCDESRDNYNAYELSDSIHPQYIEMVEIERSSPNVPSRIVCSLRRAFVIVQRLELMFVSLRG